MSETCKIKLIIGGCLTFIVIFMWVILSKVPDNHFSISIDDEVTKVDHCYVNDGDLFYRVGKREKTIANAMGSECINDIYKDEDE